MVEAAPKGLLMQVTDLVTVLTYAQAAYNEKGIPALYQQLSAALTQSVQPVKGKPPLDPGASNSQIVAARDKLIRALHDTEPPPTWSHSLRSIAEQLGISGTIGAVAANAVNAALAQKIADPAGASQLIQRIAQQATAASQRVSQLLGGLGSLAPPTKPLAVEHDKAIAILTFTKDSSIKSLADLKDQAGTWDLIVQTFARLTHQPIESPRVIDVRRGSIVVEIAAIASIVATLATALHQMLSAREKSLAAKKLALEIKKLDMVDEQPAKALEDAASAEIERAATATTEKLVAENGWNEDTTGEGNEVRNSVRSCVIQINNFYGNGGRIDFRFVQAQSSTAEQQQVFERASKTQEDLASTLVRLEQLSTEINSLKALPPKDAKPGG